MPRRFAALAVLATAVTAPGVASGSGRLSTPEIVFTADRLPSVYGEIYRVGADGRRMNLSRSPYKDTDPLLSPDGTQVAFFSERDGYKAVYVVGIDGRGLTRLSSRAGLETGGQVVWDPDSTRLVFVNSNALYLAQRGRRAHALTRIHGMPAWSPDGRLITVSTRRPRGHNFAEALTPEGKVVWRVHQEGSFASWSKQGRFGVSVPGGLRVYDERGHRLAGVVGRAFAWSRDGKRLASVVANRLEVRTSDGRRVVFSKALPFLGANTYAALQWIDASRLVIWGGLETQGLDVSTGEPWKVKSHLSAFNTQFGQVTATRIGKSFDLRILPFGGGPQRSIARVPGCWDDGGFGAAVAAVQFTADGRSLIYQSKCGEPFNNLYVVTPDGSRVRRLTRSNENERDPQWSPDGSRIVYARSEYSGPSCKGCPETLWVRNAGGSHPRQLTPSREGTWDSSPSWSPDGQEIVFSRARPSSQHLVIVHAAGGRARSFHVSGEHPAWGPLGIVYDGASWILAPDGRQVRRITDSGWPAWSRDGRLAFLDTFDEEVRIEIVGQPTRRLRLPLKGATGIAWSPDGRKLALTARANATAPSDVYTVDADGRHLKRLTWNLNASGVSWRG